LGIVGRGREPERRSQERERENNGRVGMIKVHFIYIYIYIYENTKGGGNLSKSSSIFYCPLKSIEYLPCHVPRPCNKSRKNNKRLY
jgi:hypothetical protein